MPISRYSVRRFHSIVVILFTILTGTASAIGGIDVDGNGKSQILLRNSNGQSMLGRWTNNALVFTPTADPGPAFRLLGAADFNGNGKSDLAFQDLTQGESGDVRIWTDGASTNNVLLRSVKRTWDVQVVGDLDGDGYADLVWRMLLLIRQIPASHISGSQMALALHKFANGAVLRSIGVFWARLILTAMARQT